MKPRRFRNSYDEDIERDRRFPWRRSFRRPMGGASSMLLVVLMMAIYMAAAAVIFASDGRPIFPARMSIPFH